VNQVFCLDYKEFFDLLEDDSVDLILTDPPYARKYLPLYTGLAAQSARVLRVGGSLCSMVPTFMLPEVLATMGMYLKWRWLISQSYRGGSHARLSMGIQVGYKPIVWYVKEKLSPRRCICDEVAGGKREKDLHPWQQSLDWAMYLIEHLTDEGDLVVDPFVGSGTVMEAAHRLKRRWMVNDNDPKAVDTTLKRLVAYA